MAVTLGSVIATILTETNRDSATYGSMVQDSILTAIKYMEAEHPYVFEKVGTITITATNNSTALPSDLSQILNAYYTSPSVTNVIFGSYQGFTQISYNDLISLFATVGQSGAPQKYALFANSFWIFPVTANDINITLSYYYKDMSYPAVSTDSSIWFGDFTIDCVIAKATEDFYRYALQTPDLADRYLISFKDFIQNLQSRTNQRQVLTQLSI